MYLCMYRICACIYLVLKFVKFVHIYIYVIIYTILLCTYIHVFVHISRSKNGAQILSFVKFGREKCIISIYVYIYQIFYNKYICICIYIYVYIYI